MARSLRIPMPHLTGTRTTLLVKASLLLYCSLVTKLPYSHVTDLINRIVQVLRGDLYWVRISARDAELMEPVKP